MQESLSRWSWGIPPCQHVDAFTNLEDPQTPWFKAFLIEVHYVDMIVPLMINLFCSHYALSEG